MAKQVSVLPLVHAPELLKFTAEIVKSLKEEGLSSKVDETGHRIGRRYARTDEIGVPFGITIDFDTPVDGTITLRERDTTNQVFICLYFTFHSFLVQFFFFYPFIAIDILMHLIFPEKIFFSKISISVEVSKSFFYVLYNFLVKCALRTKSFLTIFPRREQKII